MIVPRKCVAELRKLLEEALDTNVEVDLSASKVRFTLGGENGVAVALPHVEIGQARLVPEWPETVGRKVKR